MLKWLKNFLIKNSISNDENLKETSYVDEIEFDKCRNFNGNISILFIADTHGSLQYNYEDFEKVASEPYDLCIMLGDIDYRDIEIILKLIPKEKIYGVLGNHDNFSILDSFEIPNIHLKVIDCKGVKIAGFQGTFKYSTKDLPMYTHEESIELLESLEPADIIVTHDRAFTYDIYGNPAHNGLKGITNYILKNGVPYHVHGHLHTDETYKLDNGTTVYSIYKYKIIHFNKQK